jgi:ABC-2 type transport system permease protein
MHLMIPHTLLQSTRYPLSIYPGWVHYILLVLIPYGVFSYLPASFLFNKDLASWTAIVAPFAALLFFWEAQKAWQWGINQYESTGS